LGVRENNIQPPTHHFADPIIADSLDQIEQFGHLGDNMILRRNLLMLPPISMLNWPAILGLLQIVRDAQSGKQGLVFRGLPSHSTSKQKLEHISRVYVDTISVNLEISNISSNDQAIDCDVSSSGLSASQGKQHRFSGHTKGHLRSISTCHFETAPMHPRSQRFC
jgi:hypothetical protein